MRRQFFRSFYSNPAGSGFWIAKPLIARSWMVRLWSRMFLCRIPMANVEIAVFLWPHSHAGNFFSGCGIPSTDLLVLIRLSAREQSRHFSVCVNC